MIENAFHFLKNVGNHVGSSKKTIKNVSKNQEIEPKSEGRFKDLTQKNVNRSGLSYAQDYSNDIAAFGSYGKEHGFDSG